MKGMKKGPGEYWKEKLARQRYKLWYVLIFTPIWQEFLFRYLPYRYLYLPTGKFWEIGLTTSLVFASIHWYFGKWFVAYTFFWGLVVWLVMGRFGLLGAIFLHSFLNMVDLKLGIRKFLSSRD